MKPDNIAWQHLRKHAAAQLRPGFADRVLHVTHGSATESAAWIQLQARATARLRPGFAQRVLLAARSVTEPSFVSHVLLSAATAAVCVCAVIFVHQRTTNAENARSLAGWEQLAAETEDAEINP